MEMKAYFSSNLCS